MVVSSGSALQNWMIKIEGNLASRLLYWQGALHTHTRGPDPDMGLEEVSDTIPRMDGCCVALQSKVLWVCWAGL